MRSAAYAHEVETVAKIPGDETVGYQNKSEAEKALNFTLENDGILWTAEEEAKIVTKIDLLVLPLTFGAGILTSADAGAYGVAAIFGMIVDLKLFDIVSHPSGTTIDLNKYSWSSSIFTFGGLMSTFPLLYLVQRMPFAKAYGFAASYSGVFALLMLAVHDFSGAMVLRFFYGFQGVLLPIFIMYTSMWYTQIEQPVRLAICASGSSFGVLVGQGIDFGAANIGGAYKTSPWKWMYVILGAITVFWGLLYMIFVPDSPMTAKFLNQRERLIVIQRVRRNGTGMQSTKFKLGNAIKVLKDPQLYGFLFIAFTIQFANSSLGSFGALLTTSFGYSNENALKLGMPAAGMAVVSMLSSGLLTKIFPNKRILIAALYLLPTIAGNLMLWRSARDDKGALLGGLYISVFFYGTYVQLLGLIASNVGGQTKKTTVTALVFVFSSAGGIIAPFTFKGSEASKGYPTGIITILTLMILDILVLVGLFFNYTWYNRKADISAGLVTGEGGTVDDTPFAGFHDLTERELTSERSFWTATAAP